MVIGIDGNEANVKELVGVSVYTQNILEYFQSKATSKIRFKVFLRSPALGHLPKETEFFSYRIVSPSFLFSQVTLPLALFKERDVDVFWTPAHYAPRLVSIPTVVTVHDLSYFYYPQEFLRRDLFKLKRWTGYSVRHAAKVIAVSQHTKKDVEKFYKVSPDKIQVIYNGYQRRDTKSKSKERKRNLKLVQGQYILYVGTLQPRKNILTLIRAFELFHKSNPDFKLVLVGKKGWLYDEIFALVKTHGLAESVIFAGFVSDNELSLLYKNSFCFVLPSFYEGFGIPLLEAMSEGTPVIAAGSSSLPEVGGNACLYFDPHNVQTLFLLLKRLKGNDALALEMIKKGKKRVEAFSWKKSAQETLKVLVTAAKENS